MHTQFAMRLLRIISAGASISYLTASQSLVLSPGHSGTFSVPNSAPFNGLGSFRLEFRAHNVETPVNQSVVWSLNDDFVLNQLSQTHLTFSDWKDTFNGGQGNAIFINILNRIDFVVRCQRDVPGKQLICETWNVDGSNYVMQKLPIDTVVESANVTTRASYFGGAQTKLHLGYFRLYSELLATGQKLPTNAPGGDLADWEFPGNTTDASGRGLNLSFSGVLFSSTPVYDPVAALGLERTMRAGFTTVLNASRSYSLAGDDALAYSWQQLSGPTTLIWGNRLSMQTLISASIFGSYRIRLTVTDSNGRSSSTEVTLGAVASDDNGIVVHVNPDIEKLFGPMIRFGANPWPWFDDRHMALADKFGALQSSASWQPLWEIPATGTVSITRGSATITGVGTGFKSAFCGGGNSWDNDRRIIIWYPVAGIPGKFGRRMYDVASCASDTTLILTRAWNTSASASNLNYTIITNAEMSVWIGNQSNINFYDNVMAFYSLYYRSGIEVYLQYARTLADRWWSSPFVDEGRTCSDNEGSTCMFPRNRAMTGLVARALDGRPDMWPGLRFWWDVDRYSIKVNLELGDLREKAYQVAFVSLCGIFDPDLVHRAACAADVTSALGIWANQQKPTGEWQNLTHQYSTWNGFPGTVSVTNGSTTVIGSGTNWQPSWFVDPNFWTANNDSGVTGGDITAYVATYVSPTQLTLNKPYEGPTASGRAWQLNNLVGRGTSPFVLGIVAAAFHYAHLATGDARARQFILDTVNWLRIYGYRPLTRGLWYGRGFPNCEPISEDNYYCAPGGPSESRVLAGEIVNAFNYAYLYDPQPVTRDFGDQIYGAMFGKKGDLAADSFYIDGLENSGFYYQSSQAKYLGFFFGFGAGSVWPAMRLGTVQPVEMQTNHFALDYSAFPEATQARLTIQHPTGAVTQTICTANSDCSVVFDARLGSPLITVEYLSVSKVVLAKADPHLLAVHY